jgi:hypothetical protein
MKFPPLYECSECGASVKVSVVDDKTVIERKCGHDATIWANRKVTLRGKGNVNIVKKTAIKITLTVRQFLSYLSGRSI